MTKKVIAFSGSNSSQSINQALVKIAASKLKDAEVTIISLQDYELPLYSQDLEQNEGFPDKAKELKALIVEHDALIIASPEHNGSMPAVFKNTIDWLSRMVEPMQPFFGDEKKSVLLLSTSPGPTGGKNGLAHLASLMPWWGGDVKATYSLGSFYDHFLEGKLSSGIDHELTLVVDEFVREL
ncbi:MAG: NAD(P)H-dependent oxidoreductase [Oleispira sp.]